MRPKVRKKRLKVYFLPFLIIIGLGVFFVVSLNFFRGLNDRPQSNELDVFVVEGQAKIQSWGSHEWHTALGKDRLLSADKIRTSTNGRVILKFVDDFGLHLSGNSQLNIGEIFDVKNMHKVEATFSMGKLWIQKANLTLNTNDIKFIADIGDIVDVEQTTSGVVVRVLQGTIDIDVLKLEDTKVSVVDTVTVGEGREAIFDADTLALFREYQRPFVDDDIERSFFSSAWYLWNQSVLDGSLDYETLASQQQAEDTFLDLDPPTKPTIISPPGITEEDEFVFDGDALNLSGTVSNDTAKVKVIYSAGNIEATHNLLEFQSGSGQWLYKISTSKGNLQAGLNRYTVIASDALGNESDPLVVSIRYGNDPEPLEENPATPQVGL